MVSEQAKYFADVSDVADVLFRWQHMSLLDFTDTWEKSGADNGNWSWTARASLPGVGSVNLDMYHERFDAQSTVNLNVMYVTVKIGEFAFVTFTENNADFTDLTNCALRLLNGLEFTQDDV
jgi:hypothetical protein